MHKGRGICLLTIASVLLGFGDGLAIESNGKKTPEYIILRENLGKISKSIEAEIDEFTRDLHSAGVIPSQRFSGNVMDIVLSEVEAIPLNFYAFLHVLDERNSGDRYSQLLKRIDSGVLDEMRKYLPSNLQAQECEVFISFSRRRAFGDESPDARKQAIDINDMLEKEGLRTWIDKSNLDTGDSLTEKIFSGLKHCKALVPVITRGYAQSLWCLREFYFFSLTHSSEDSEHNIFPIMGDEAEHLDREKAGKWLQKRVKVVKFLNLKFKQAQDLVKTLKEKYLQGTLSISAVPTPVAGVSTPEAVSAKSPTNTEIKSLHELYQAVKDIGDWKSLCSNLKVNEAKMSSLDYDSKPSVWKKQDCLQAYFNMGEATWEDVVKAVRDYPISNNIVANQIATTYIRKKDEL